LTTTFSGLKQKMKNVGILGGVGPETTANFYLYIMAECQRLAGSNRPNVLISSLPIPYATEESALLHGKDVDAFKPFLIREAKLLEKAGADFIVMPCNTLHRFENDIREAISIPFISIVDVVSSFLKNGKDSKIGLIATGITLETKFYQNRFDKIGIDSVIPDAFQQAKIAKMIHGLVTGCYANNQRQVLIDIIEDFTSQGVTMILLACTDLQALIPHHPGAKIVDTMQLLADEVVSQIHKGEPDSYCK
jgi:aspartate racemase